MANRFNTLGLSFRVVLFFGRNPDEELSTNDIAEKFEVDPEDVRPMLRRALQHGLLSQPTRGGGPGSFAMYAAGPMLLQACGLPMEACSPVGRR